jgi:TonB-linked SusC/RagA family outer membrane protein
MIIFKRIINRYCTCFIATSILLVSIGISAQENDNPLSGKVIDQFGNPISGVVISIKGNTTKNVTTNADGLFNIDANAKSLEFSHPDFLQKEVKIKTLKRQNIQFKITLLHKFIENKPTVSGAYEDKERKSYLGSESSIYTDRLSSTMASTIIPSLMGRVTGLNIFQYRGSRLHQTNANYSSAILGQIPNFGTGAYSDNTEFSIGSRGVSPIVIVDGIQRDLYSLDPDAIESVSLQKDALSSMFLGMRSSRGALIITTKKPMKEGFQLSFTSRLGVQSTIKKPKPLSTYQYAYLLNEALQNDGKDPFYSYDDFVAFRNHSNPYTHPDVNWFDELLKDNTTTQSYNLNVSGGNNFAQYFVSLGYMTENGLFRESSSAKYDTNLSLDRYLITSKVNINVTHDFTAGLTMMGRVEEGNQPGGSGNGYSDLIYNLYITPNNAYPVLNPNGTWGGNVSFTNNLKSQAVNAGYISDNTRDVIGSIQLKYNFDKLVKGLSAKMIGDISAQYRNTTNRTKRSPVYQYKENTDGSDSYSMYGSTSTQTNSFSPVYNYQYMYGQFAIDYNRQFGLHGIKASVMGDTKKILSNYDLPQLPSNVITDIAYNYADRYFAQFALSNSYYNRYAPGKRWGTFYALGLGWDISKEAFMKDIDWVNLLKLRMTYGKTGNGIDNSGYYTYYQTFSTDATTWYMQGTTQSKSDITYENSPMANTNITWEKALKLNIGVDISLLNNTLQITADYYNDKYYDLLQGRGKSIELMGISYPYENIGKNRIYGAELSLTYQNHLGKLNYYITGNWSKQQTKLLYMDEQKVAEPYLKQTGHPTGSIFGLVAEGLFQSKEEIANSSVISGFNNILPGDVKYKDLNKDGVIDEFDRTIIGGDKPICYFGLEYGLEYKGLEFSMLWQGAYNRDEYLSDWNLLEGFQKINQQYGQAYQVVTGRWTPETAKTATLPRLTAGGNTYNRGNGWNSSFWMRSGNFLRLRNLSFSYTLPAIFCHNYLRDSRIKLFINGQNLITMAACKLVDPEVSFTSYPLQRCISAGFNIKF